MKIGLYFGSFNPVHHGHLIIAGFMLEYAQLNEVWMVVSPQNPLKLKNALLPDYHRLHLLELALQEHPHIKASNVEFNLSKPSYTINTLVHLQEKYPHHEFSLILGSDNLESLTKWKNYEQLLANYTLYVYPRPNHSGGDLKNHPHVKFINAPLMELSSTFIRNAIKDKRDVSFMLPHATWKYIDEMNFYRK